MKILFDYRLGSLSGQCVGTSFKQALDRAKYNFVIKHCRVDPKSGKFLVEKGKLKDADFRLSLAEPALDRYRRLYRAYQQGDISQEQLDQLNQFQQIFKEKDAYHESH